MKTAAIVVLLIIGLAATFIAFNLWDSRRNRGREFGYYGEYNRVSNALISIPGVVVTQQWHNLDVTLEEFGFDLTITGSLVRLYFGETDLIRSMSREKAITALKRRIATELSASTNQ